MVYKNLKRVGTYTNRHLYGFSKIHKSTTDPPLRPIISMSGAVTHDVAHSDYATIHYARITSTPFNSSSFIS